MVHVQMASCCTSIMPPEGDNVSTNVGERERKYSDDLYLNVNFPLASHPKTTADRIFPSRASAKHTALRLDTIHPSHHQFPSSP